MAVENDVVLIYLEDSPVFFARVESIWPDVKKDWFNIELLILQVPLTVVVWTLKDLYINGEEFFMDGRKMRMEVVEAPDDEFESEGLHNNESNMDEADGKDPEPDTSKPFLPEKMPSKKSDQQDKSGKGAQIISFADLQKKRKQDQDE